MSASDNSLINQTIKLIFAIKIFKNSILKFHRKGAIIFIYLTKDLQRVSKNGFSRELFLRISPSYIYIYIYIYYIYINR